MAKDKNYPKRIKTVYIGEGVPEVIEIELPISEAEQIPKDAKLDVIGKSHTRLEANERVSGRAKFVSDLKFPGMLYGKCVRSEKAKALVKSVDFSTAEAMRGVKGALNLKSAATSETGGKEFAQVRYVGDIIAAVAAETEKIADEAARAVKVEYEELPHTVTIENAMRPDAPKALDSDNIARGRPVERGSTQEGFAQAGKVIEAEYTTQVEVHHPLEPHATIVKWEGDQITIYDGTQTIGPVKAGMVRALRRQYPDLNIQENKVRVLCEYVGGGFGSKIGPNNHVIVTARLAKQLNAPVKMVLDRYEQSVDAGNRPDSIQRYKIGAKNDGTLTAIELQGYGSGGVRRADGLTVAAAEMYKCPNVKAVSQSVYTNAGPAKAFRAPGHVQAFFGFESLMDELAYALDMDPIELRKKNFSDKSANGTGRPYSSNALLECYKKGAKAIGWPRRNKTPGSGTGVKKRGMGMAAGQWSGVGGPNSLVEVDIFKDGSINVRNGTQEIGTGTRTIMAQVAAEMFGLKPTDINIQIGDSDYPEGSPSYGSINCSSVCPAVYNSSLDALSKLYPIVAAKYNVTPDDLEVEKGNIQVKGKPSRRMNYKEAARQMTGNKVMGSARRRPNPQDYAGNVFMAPFVEVEVDTETGVVKIIKVVSTHDAGRIINPMTAENQILGGVYMGIGFALMEDRIMDNRTGRMVNANLHSYKMLPSTEAPEIETIFADSIDLLQNNLGCKGLGEPPMISIAAAIANAVYNAAGVRIRSLPITPDKVLAELAKGGRS